jgi:hypothetical protein
MKKERIRLADGRYLIFYSFADEEEKRGGEEERACQS